MTSDAIWRELAEVCVQLSHHDEALAAFAKITDMRQRREIHHLLQRHGLLRRDANGNGDAEDATTPRNLKDEVLDSVRILFEDHMPLTTVVTTMTFPVVVGLGGFLTSTTNSFLFPAIAALPALCVAAIVGGLSRRIFIDAAHGIQDPPRIPELRELSHQSGRFVLDAVVLTLALLGPAILLGLLNGPMASTFVAAALGAFLLPGALAIRQLTNDWRALSPNYLFAAVTRLRGDYLATASVCGLVALPAVLATMLTTGSQIYLQASVVGPLAVAPLFFASRLLGLMVHANRHDLGDILGPTTQPAPATEGRRLTSLSATPTQQASSDFARPVLRTTAATPPRVAAVERRPAPAVGPLPNSAPRPAAPAHPETKQRVQARPQPAAAAKPKPAPAGLRRPLADKPGPRQASAPAAPVREPHPLNTIAVRGAGVEQAPAPEPVVARSRALGGTHKAVAATTGASRSPSAPSAPSPSARPASAESSAQAAERQTVAVTDKAPPDFTQLPGFNVVTGAARLLSGASSKGKRRP